MTADPIDTRMPRPANPIEAAWLAAADRGDSRQAELLEQALEESDRPPRRNGIRADGAALWYANRGLRVFPLASGEKRPAGSIVPHGVKEATTDLETVAGWPWEAPHATPLNIGIATGGPYDVLDIDGPGGAKLFSEVLGDGAWLVVRGVSQTPRGWHIWVPADPTARNLGTANSHVDYRGLGGYVVAPPSHVGGTLYRWLLPPVL